uniref:neurochondrin n=1 Tax=Erigeron canadensis TaxID=72917 RepID=UPI001CB89D80|nr:neurochondrin [Erigeron canadensis]
MEQQAETSGPSLDDCLKLLKGDRDEQRLAGLLLATKFCKNDDVESIFRVYNAVGPTFLDRLLRTGMGKGSSTENIKDNQDAYLQLSVTILSAFCRVPSIASSDDMLKKIPIILEVLSREHYRLGPTLVEECFEFLYLVSTAHKEGTRIFYESGGMTVLASQMCNLLDGSHIMELTMKLLQLNISQFSLDRITKEYCSELSSVVTELAKQFALSHNALKFEALHLLSSILSSTYAAPLHEALHTMSDMNWTTYARVGVVAVLQNRVAPHQRLEALILAESVMCIAGEQWLIGKTNLPETQVSIPADRCTLLVLESSRVEIAVLLNDLAYLKYEKSKDLLDVETIIVKQRNLGISYSLVEKTIKLISSVAEDGGNIISDTMFTKLITGLNETVGLILEYLRDAKDHGKNIGNDFLASVRIVGSYLAETPAACSEKVMELLGYMVMIQGEDEPSPFSSVCFLVPMLCQITMEIDGCRLIVSSGVYKAVVECLIKLLSEDTGSIEENGPIFLACDTILNLLLKSDQIQLHLDDTCFIKLLGVLSSWAEDAPDWSTTMMASSICALILDSTCEAVLLGRPLFNHNNLISLSQLMRRSMASHGKHSESEADLLQIVVSGYSRWANLYPSIKAAVEGK